MAASTASITPPTLVASSTGISKRKTGNVSCMTRLNSFGGLKAHDGTVAALGVPECTERSFARIVSSLRSPGKRRGGGALSSRCSAADEIFRIAAIMNGLVVIGVAVGFILLRIEASVEEAE